MLLVFHAVVLFVHIYCLSGAFCVEDLHDKVMPMHGVIWFWQ